MDKNDPARLDTELFMAKGPVYDPPERDSQESRLSDMFNPQASLFENMFIAAFEIFPEALNRGKYKTRSEARSFFNAAVAQASQVSEQMVGGARNTFNYFKKPKTHRKMALKAGFALGMVAALPPFAYVYFRLNKIEAGHDARKTYSDGLTPEQVNASLNLSLRILRTPQVVESRRKEIRTILRKDSMDDIKRKIDATISKGSARGLADHDINGFLAAAIIGFEAEIETGQYRQHTKKARDVLTYLRETLQNRRDALRQVRRPHEAMRQIGLN